MICTLEELMEDVFYDWGFTQGNQINKMTLPEKGFWVNKTYIFERNGEFFLNYKTDEAPIEPEIFQEFSKMAEAYLGDSGIREKLNDYGSKWGDKDFPKNEFKQFLKQFKV